MNTHANTPTPTRTRPLLVAAAIPSALSLAWTAWSIADMVPAPWPVALAAGIALDVALVAAVALAWVAPQVTRGAQVASWAIAALAAVAIGAHSLSISPALVLLAAVPLVAKALWHLALVAKTGADAAAEQAQAARREAEQARAEKDRRLSTALTEDEEAEIADLERQAAFVQEQAAAQRKLDAARSEAEHEAKLAKIEREAHEQMKADEATAKIHVNRHKLAQRINLAAPVAAPQHQQLPSVPDDASSLTPPQGGQAGFGGAFTAAATAPTAAGGASAADLGVPRGASPAASPGASAGASPGSEPVSGPDRLAAYLADTGAQATVRGAARTLGVDPRTVRRYRDRLAEAGHDVSALS